jgi:hypothetical protein
MRRIHTYSRPRNNDGSTQQDNDRKRVADYYQRWPGYQFVGDYLKYIKPRLAALKTLDLSKEDRARQWQREFKEALHTRITLKCGTLPHGRKWDEKYQTEQMRDCYRIRDRAQRRIQLYQIATPELLDRFSHLVTSREDW